MGDEEVVAKDPTRHMSSGTEENRREPQGYAPLEIWTKDLPNTIQKSL